MILHRFYCPEMPSDGVRILLPEAEGLHAMRVLRLSPGDRVLLLDGKGTLAQAEIDSGSTLRKVSCTIQEKQLHPEPPVRWTLYVAPPKGKTFDLVLKMATELGVWRIVPILCQYGVSKPSDVSSGWAPVLETAIKQSVNPWMPDLQPPTDFSKALDAADANGYYGAVPAEGQDSAPLATVSGMSLWIGPEGGFSPEELERLRAKGLRPLTIGARVLRVETAVSALLGSVLTTHRS